MRYRTSYIFLVLALSFTLLPSCLMPIFKSKTSEKAGCIPPDVGIDSTIIIAVTHNRMSYDKYLIKNFNKVYNGKFIFVAEDTIESALQGIYQNKEKYRFVFDYGIGNVYVWEDSHNEAFSTNKYYIYDRKENKKYYSKITSSFFSKVMRAYIINLEKKREQNQEKSSLE
jgi:hypothetical protein